METPKIDAFIEIKPEHYKGNIGLTMTCKQSERWLADLFLQLIQGIEGWEITINTTSTNTRDK